MANINVGELIIVNTLPTQAELNSKSITVGGATKTFGFPVVFRKVGNGMSASVDYTYRNAVDAPVSSFNPDLSLIEGLNIVDGKLSGVFKKLTIPENETSVIDYGMYDQRISSVEFHDGVVSLGVSAFNTNLITEATLPTNCTYYSSTFDSGVTITGGILIS